MLIEVKTTDDLPIAAGKIVETFKGCNVIAFYGIMGAGKTTLIKEICKRLGVCDRISSPTFSLVNEYKANHGKKIFHFDFYRINSPEEVYDMGYEDYFYSKHLCLIEWPEKIERMLPENTIKIKIELVNETRILSLAR